MLCAGTFRVDTETGNILTLSHTDFYLLVYSARNSMIDALDNFLFFCHIQVSECWRTYNLDLINYQNKCKLIRGWDELFEKVKEHINSVTAMKLSPYYKEFEEEANNWSDKLNRIHDCFDIWIDVQRRWVYLEGIFTGSADIKNLLPVETSRFQVYVLLFTVRLLVFVMYYK